MQFFISIRSTCKQCVASILSLAFFTGINYGHGQTTIQNTQKYSLSEILNSELNDTVKVAELLTLYETTKENKIQENCMAALDSIVDYHLQNSPSTVLHTFYSEKRARSLLTKAVKFRSDGSYHNAINHYDEVLKIGKEIASKKLQSAANNGLGLIASRRDNDSLAIYYYKKAFQLDESFHPLNNIGIIYTDKGDYNNALRHYQMAVDIVKNDINQQDNLATCQSNIGGLFYEIALYDIALQYYSAAEQIFAKSLSPLNLQITQLNIAKTHYNLYNFNKAEQEFLGLLPHLKAKFLRPHIYEGLAQLYYSKGDLILSELYFQKALDETEEISNTKIQTTCYLGLSEIKKCFNLNDQAHSYAEKAYEIATKNNYKKEQSEAAFILSKSFENNNDLRNALFYSRAHAKIKIQLDSNQNKGELIRKELRDLHDKNLKQVVVAHENEKKVLNKKRWWGLVAFSIISLMLLILFLFSNRYQKGRTAKLIAELQQVKKRILIHKNSGLSEAVVQLINKNTIEEKMDCKLNETDWNIIKLLIDDPTTTNKILAKKVCRSLSGIRSSLKKMYAIFDIDDTYRDKRILLIIKITQLFER